MIPILETSRLNLRAFDKSDFETFAPFYASEASRFVGGPDEPYTTWRRLAAYAGCWSLRGYGKFVVEEKASGSAVGIVGPWHPDGWPEAEIGWTILPRFQRLGYAMEAAIRAIQFVYDNLGWKTAVSTIFKGNEASFALAHRLGATSDGEFEYGSHGKLEIWRHLSPIDFRARFGGVE